MIPQTFEEIQDLVQQSLDDLFAKDGCLLENDSSERVITHKLAEHIQKRVPHLNVDCEYNRNSAAGEKAPKRIQVLKEETQNLRRKELDESEWLSLSTYPDIIVHQRLTNEFNLLVIEVKKKNSSVPHTHDHRKLRAFTEDTEQNSYHFRYGVFIVLEMGTTLSKPEIRWFANGREEASIDENSVSLVPTPRRAS